MKRFLVAAAAVALFAVPAGAATITFNGAGAANQVLGNNIIQNGFQISASQCAGSNCFTLRSAATAGTGSDGLALETYAYAPVVTISQLGGGAFTLQSFALTGVQLPAAYLSNFDVVFRFNYADGSIASLATSVDANFSTPTSYVIQSQIAGFTTKALTSFSIESEAGSQAIAKLQIDNINVSPLAAAVPEPATWAMMIGGFGLVGASLRRRRATVSFA